MDFRWGFAAALRFLRVRQGLSQEDFSVVSSRTYISQMERGETSPTLHKIDELSPLLAVHPASVVMLSYLVQCDSIEQAHHLLEEMRIQAGSAIGDYFESKGV